MDERQRKERNEAGELAEAFQREKELRKLDANKAKSERDMRAVKGNTGEVKTLVSDLKSADSAPPERPKGGGYLL